MISVRWRMWSRAPSSTLVMSLSIRRSWLRLASGWSQEVETTWRKLWPREREVRLGRPASEAVPSVRILL